MDIVPKTVVLGASAVLVGALCAAYVTKDTIARERETLARERETLARERETISAERMCILQERELLATERSEMWASIAHSHDEAAANTGPETTATMKGETKEAAKVPTAQYRQQQFHSLPLPASAVNSLKPLPSSVAQICLSYQTAQVDFMWQLRDALEAAGFTCIDGSRVPPGPNRSPNYLPPTATSTSTLIPITSLKARTGGGSFTLLWRLPRSSFQSFRTRISSALPAKTRSHMHGTRER